MTKPKSSSRSEGLLAALKQQGPKADPPLETSAPVSAPSAESDPQPKRITRASAASPVTKSRVGKPVQFWIHEEDRRRLRELAAWLAGQGERPSDSMVIRAALRVTQTTQAFLDAYREAAQLDGRLKERRHP
jgi:hypothetical protein